MLQYKIALSMIQGIGDITAKKLLAYCGGLEEVFCAKKSSLQKIPGIGSHYASSVYNNRKDALDQAEKEMRFIEKNKISTLFFLDDEYPSRLKNCIDGPVMLYYRGNADLNCTKIISVVGTRNATGYGKECCRNIIAGFKDSGILVVSGLAYGIDSCAHKEALKNNLNTVGVLAHGLDILYPSQNHSLAAKMLSQGGLLTDFPGNTTPEKENFPKRNRIIAGLADATLVVEAAKKGGALITADIADSYNRDVFAVPGRINDTYSEGCNYFIKKNRAALIQNAEDILFMMGWDDQPKKNAAVQRKLFISLSPEEEAVMGLLKAYPGACIDEICGKLQLNTSKVAAVLLNLEFEGLIKCLPGKVYQLCD